MPELTGEQRNEILEHTNAIGRILLETFPATYHQRDYEVCLASAKELGLTGQQLTDKVTAMLDADYYACFIPAKAVEEIGEEITGVVAEIITWWLNAGSEREVTLEELTEPITEHLRGWSSTAGLTPSETTN